MAELVEAGKVRYLGLSEAATRRSAARTPCTRSPRCRREYSLWTRDLEAEMLPTVRELGIGFVAYSPLGRGFLTGTFANTTDLADDDYRRFTRASPKNELRCNARSSGVVAWLHERKHATPAQVALAWVLARGDDVVPIPGTKRGKYLEHNLASLDLQLDAADLAEIEAVFTQGAAAGTRYTESGMAAINL